MFDDAHEHRDVGQWIHRPEPFRLFPFVNNLMPATAFIKSSALPKLRLTGC